MIFDQLIHFGLLCQRRKEMLRSKLDSIKKLIDSTVTCHWKGSMPRMPGIPPIEMWFLSNRLVEHCFLVVLVRFKPWYPFHTFPERVPLGIPKYHEIGFRWSSCTLVEGTSCCTASHCMGHWKILRKVDEIHMFCTGRGVHAAIERQWSRLKK